MSSLVISGDTSGTVTLAAPAIAGSNTLTLQAATATNSINTLATAVASTSGTSIEFTALPSWVKRITMMFQNVSTNSTNNIHVQLGTGSTSYTISGYLGSTTTVAAGSTGCNLISVGFTCGAGNQGAATVLHGSIVITNITGNNWVANGNFGKSDSVQLNTVGGSISLGAALTAVRIIASATGNPSDTFDLGTVNILYEG